MLENAKIINPLFDKPDIQEKAARLLKDAGCYGVLPTPLDKLLQVAGVTALQPHQKDGYIKTLSEAAKRRFFDAFSALRGYADAREKIIYIPEGQKKTRERFAQAHEIFHQISPHHFINGNNLGDFDWTLAPGVKDSFEREANFGGAELLFQGRLFEEKVRSTKADLDSALYLADLHQVSYQATIWKYVESQSEQVCVLPYYNKDDGRFRCWKGAASESFLSKYGDIDPPLFIDEDHDWAHAANTASVISGTCTMDCGLQKVEFQWSAWSNRYTIFVMLRRRPAGHKIGGIIMPPKKAIIMPTVKF